MIWPLGLGAGVNCNSQFINLIGFGSQKISEEFCSLSEPVEACFIIYTYIDISSHADMSEVSNAECSPLCFLHNAPSEPMCSCVGMCGSEMSPMRHQLSVCGEKVMSVSIDHTCSSMTLEKMSTVRQVRPLVGQSRFRHVVYTPRLPLSAIPYPHTLEDSGQPQIGNF